MNTDSSEPTSKIIDVTPDMARQWLKKMVRNRPMTSSHVRFLAEQMEADKWALNGESIKFDTSGSLMDGQHRLAAIIQSGKTIRMRVDFGIEPGTFSTIDTGRVRDNKDILALQKEENPNILAAALRWLKRLDGATDKESSSGTLGSNTRISNAAVIILLEKYSGVRESIGPALQQKHMPASMLAALHYLFSLRHSREKAHAFLGAIVNGATPEADNPMHIFREMLISNRALRHKKLTAEAMAASAVKAFNAMAMGHKINRDRIRWKKEESFPEVVTPEDVSAAYETTKKAA